MSAKDVENRCQQPWNPKGWMPLHTWLWHEASDLDLDRLHALGNIVMPRCGQLALHLLGRHHTDSMCR